MDDQHNHEPHDLGGLPIEDPIDREEHPKTWFDKRVNAMLRLLTHPDRSLMVADELRRGIESLTPEQYANYTYYEKWINSIRTIMVEKGVVEEAELLRKMDEVKNRLAKIEASDG